MKAASEAKPNIGRVIIKPIESPVKSLIIDPNKNKDEVPQYGEVVKVGKRKPGEEEYASEGDTVVYGRYAGVMLTFADGEHLVMFESEILSIV